MQKHDFLPDNLFPGTILGYMKGIKVDIIQYLYPNLNEPIVTDSIRMASAQPGSGKTVLRGGNFKIFRFREVYCSYNLGQLSETN